MAADDSGSASVRIQALTEVIEVVLKALDADTPDLSLWRKAMQGTDKAAIEKSTITLCEAIFEELHPRFGRSD